MGHIGMKLSDEPMFVPDLEKASDAKRIFALIDHLKQNEPVEFFKDIASPWTVVFKGEPSHRHANLISIFREFLSEKLWTDIRVAGGRPGSVKVVFTADQGVSDQYIDLSKDLMAHKEAFEQIAARLGISAIEFNNQPLNF